MRSLLPSLFLSLSFASQLHAFYFELKPGRKLCFVEEVDVEGEMLMIDYAQRWTNENIDDEFRTQLSVISPRRRVIHTAKLTQVNGTAMVRAPEGALGEYKICVVALNRAEPVDFAIAIDTRNKIEIVEDQTPDSNRQSVTEHGVEMQVMSYVDSDGEVKETLRTRWFFYRIKREVSVMRAKIRQATFAAGYLKKRLGALRDAGQSGLRRVIFFGAAKAILIIVLSVWQYKHFQAFLYKKKIV